MKIVFMGTPQAAVPSLERLVESGHEVVAVYTQPDRPAGRGNKLTAPPVKVRAVELGLSVFQPTKIRTAEAIDSFRAHNADVAVVVAYGRILPADYLTAFPKGAINVHFSLLPKYRGAAPVNWAIVNGETETGVTTMQMDEGLDTGDILLQERTAIRDDETSISLMERLSFVGAELLINTLDKWGTLTPLKQDDAFASLAPIMTKADGKIDWSLPANEIERRVRGFQPFPTAFTYLQGKKVTLWSATVAEPGLVESSPGKIIEAGGGRLAVACGQGTSLAINEIQIEGKRRMTTRDFLNGVKVAAGESFSSE